jgi:arylformamidase
MASDYTKEELDYYYSPSRFSIRNPATTVNTHIEILRKSTMNARSVIKCELGIEYDMSSGQKMDIYYPPSGMNDDTVIFMYLHGGYWQELSLDDSGYMVVPLANKNIICAIVGYDLAPQVNITTIVEECRQASIFLATKFPNKKLFVGGHSAGAHLAAMLLVMDWPTYDLSEYPWSGAVLISGVYDLGPIKQTYVNDALQLTDDEVKNFSPLKCPDGLDNLPSDFTCLVAEGQIESPEFKRQRELYCNLLTSRGVSVKFHEMAGEDHFTITEKLENPHYQLTQVHRT